ncbi:MAG: glycosyltransferase family 4 protein [Chlamydiales bacterium]
MTKIALLKSRLHHRGGLEKYTLRLAAAFADRGCEVTLLTTGPQFSHQSFEAISVAKDSKFSLAHVYRFKTRCEKWLRTHRYDAVFGMEAISRPTHYRAGNGVHAVYLKQRRLTESPFKRASFTINPFHNLLLQNEKKLFENPELKQLFANSKMVQREILDTYKTAAHKICVVHNGVEWHEKQCDFEAGFHSVKKRPFELLFVGNDYQRKGLPFLLKGLAQLPSYDFKLTVVGRDKKVDRYQKMAEKLKLEKKIRFMGSQSSLTPFYQSADALVIPSLYDPFANVTLEALAMGLFVISSPFNGGSEVLTETSGSIIEEPTSPDSVASSVKTSFQFPKSFERARLIRNSIKELDFSNQLDKIVQKTLDSC